MFENIGGGELLIILLVIVLLFGAKKIPEVAQGIGKGIREFKKAVNDVQDDIKIAEKKDSNNLTDKKL
jgi:sec-independent protein translocase protein TatA